MVCDGERERRWVNQWMRRWLFLWKEIREPIKGYDLCPVSELVAETAAEEELAEADITKIRRKESK